MTFLYLSFEYPLHDFRVLMFRIAITTKIYFQRILLVQEMYFYYVKWYKYQHVLHEKISYPENLECCF